MNLKIISLFQGIYLIYMYNYFKTKLYFHHPIELFLQNKNIIDWFKHPISDDNYNNNICPFGNLMSFILAFWIIFYSYNIKIINYKINRFLWIVVAIVSLISNMNAFIYIIPILYFNLYYLNKKTNI